MFAARGELVQFLDTTCLRRNLAMPWTETASATSTNKTVVIDQQDALKMSAFQPFLTFNDTSAGNAQSRIQGAAGKLVMYPQSALNSGAPTVILNSIAAPSGQPVPSAVEIHAQDGVQIVGYQPFWTLLDANAGYARARIQNANGDINFFTESSFAAGVPPLKIVNATGNLEVSGDVVLRGADCAEDFDISTEDAPAGTVMVIGDDGGLRQSAGAYDRRVAGVVSGAGEYRPAIILDRQQESLKNRTCIALVGKVYCKVDADYSPIEVGDLLTTSDTPGHAMRVTDPTKAFGAVIGKALRGVRRGQVLIPILIALQ
jgi:hypothetical protein